MGYFFLFVNRFCSISFVWIHTVQKEGPACTGNWQEDGNGFFTNAYLGLITL